MHRIIGVSRFLLLSSIMVISACSKAPEKEMRLASAAIDSAMTIKANYYAPKEFEKAKDALKKAEDLRSKRQYSKAKNFAILAKKMADTSMVVSKRKKIITEIEIEQLISYLQHKINLLEKVISKAESFGVPSNEIENAKAELTELDRTLFMMILKNDEEDYETIRHEGQYAIEKASLTTYQLIKLISNNDVNGMEEQLDLHKKSGF